MTRRQAFRFWLIALCLALLLGGLALPGTTVRAASTLHVTSCADDGGAGTLRGKIGSASPGDTIDFGQDCSGASAIVLATGTLALGQDVTIDGTGRTVVVDGGCTFNGTVCTGGGVTVFVVNSGVTASLTALTIQHGNTAGQGGGISSNRGTVTVTNSTVSGNSASGGGGIENYYGTLTVTNSTIAGNSVSGGGTSGGGIETVGGGGPLTVTNSTVSGNSVSSGGVGSAYGGGIAAIAFGTVLTVTNSTFSGNRADLGGGIYSEFGTTTMTNSTLSGNRADLGGGIYNASATLTMTNTIVATNTGADVSGGFSGTANLIGGAPLLGPLGNYGGPTQTIPLLPGSPAIDAGDDPTCAATGTGKVNGVDQRGITRPQGAHCDIGAVEARFTLTVSGGTPQSTALSGPFVHPLAVTLGGADSPVDRSGAPVTFTVHPVGGAGATLGTPDPATTNASGGASVAARANGSAGTYTVTASTPGASAVTFTLTNAVLNPLPGVAPPGPTGGTANPLPGERSAGPPGGVPNPLPASRP